MAGMSTFKNVTEGLLVGTTYPQVLAVATNSDSQNCAGVSDPSENSCMSY